MGKSFTFAVESITPAQLGRRVVDPVSHEGKTEVVDCATVVLKPTSGPPGCFPDEVRGNLTLQNVSPEFAAQFSVGQTFTITLQS